jgi:hypothetical protein
VASGSCVLRAKRNLCGLSSIGGGRPFALVQQSIGQSRRDEACEGPAAAEAIGGLPRPSAESDHRLGGGPGGSMERRRRQGHCCVSLCRHAGAATALGGDGQSDRVSWTGDERAPHAPRFAAEDARARAPSSVPSDSAEARGAPPSSTVRGLMRQARATGVCSAAGSRVGKFCRLSGTRLSEATS